MRVHEMNSGRNTIDIKMAFDWVWWSTIKTNCVQHTTSTSEDSGIVPRGPEVLRLSSGWVGPMAASANVHTGLEIGSFPVGQGSCLSPALHASLKRCHKRLAILFHSKQKIIIEGPINNSKNQVFTRSFLTLTVNSQLACPTPVFYKILSRNYLHERTINTRETAMPRTKLSVVDLKA